MLVANGGARRGTSLAAPLDLVALGAPDGAAVPLERALAERPFHPMPGETPAAPRPPASPIGGATPQAAEALAASGRGEALRALILGEDAAERPRPEAWAIPREP